MIHMGDDFSRQTEPETKAEKKVRRLIESGKEDTDSYERLLELESAK